MNDINTYDNIMKKTGLLSGSTLKIIACISMFTDHAAFILWHKYRDYLSTLDYGSIMHWQGLYRLGRNIGRMAFPIFCFLLVEGFFHTRNRLKYLLRLTVMCLLSEHAFNLLASSRHLDPGHQNVFMTLAISLLTITAVSQIKIRFNARPDIISVLTIATVSLGCLLAHMLKTDYGYKGVLAIVIIYLLHSSKILTCLGTALAFLWEPWAITAVVPIFLYNGKRGLKRKYIFYAFYPLHIYLIYFVTYYILPDLT